MQRSRNLARALAMAFGLVLIACESGEPLGPANAATLDDELDTLIAQASGERSHDSRAGDTTGDGRGGDSTGDGRGGSGVALFDRLADEIPGFGGLYRIRPCAVVVVLTEDGDREQAFAVVRRALGPIMGDACADGVFLSAEKGEFTYLELRRYLHAARPLLEMRGVDRIRIDFKLNRLAIVVASREVAEAVAGRLPELGIPRAAVAFQLPPATTPGR